MHCRVAQCGSVSTYVLTSVAETCTNRLQMGCTVRCKRTAPLGLAALAAALQLPHVALPTMESLSQSQTRAVAPGIHTYICTYSTHGQITTSTEVRIDQEHYRRLHIFETNGGKSGGLLVMCKIMSPVRRALIGEYDPHLLIWKLHFSVVYCMLGKI